MARKYRAPAFDKKDKLISKINHLLFEIGKEVYPDEYEASVEKSLEEAIDEYSKKHVSTKDDLRTALNAPNRPTELEKLVEFLKGINDESGEPVYGAIEAIFHKIFDNKIRTGELNFVKKTFKKGFGFKGSYHTWTTKELSGILSVIKENRDKVRDLVTEKLYHAR